MASLLLKVVVLSWKSAGSCPLTWVMAYGKGSKLPISPNNRPDSPTAVTRAQLFISIIALDDLLVINHTTSMQKSLRYWKNGYNEPPMHKSKRTRSN